MPSVAEVDDMTKKKSGESKPQPHKPAVSSTKVRTEVLRRAKTVAAQRGIDLFDYLDEVLSEHVNADYKAAAERIKQEDD
jgi:hypothetical protein